MDSEEFKATDKAKALFDPVSKSIEDAAFKLADDFISAGQSPREACSLVAHFLLRTAWGVAGAGAIADGHAPRPDFFRDAVEQALSDISFKSVLNVKTGSVEPPANCDS